MYMGNPTASAVEAMHAGLLGCIDTPRQGRTRPAGVPWCADNGCFGKGFDEARWWAWLQRQAVDTSTCVFATAPDVVGDAAATIARSSKWLHRIRELGFPAAFVAQDGQEDLPVPWADFDVLFIGGTTEWKLGPAARGLVAEAKRRNVHVHMGRVNTRQRLRYAKAIGVDSVDGTMLIFKPQEQLDKLLKWTADVETQLTLDDQIGLFK